MSEPISRDDVAHVAHLARIDVTDAEIDHFTGHLAKILDHASQLDALDLDDVPPTTHAYHLVNVLRDDVVTQTLDRDEVIAAAPDGHDGQFRVPSILGEAP
ncbi:MAG: aspartyl-tRNA(Asn)/glutamyl-tRNA(Gln) amidotransferase subunit C [Candidatus Poriferisodalaceae bacterium]|jgi:aspartyl-tRNA(Asn)/glutamyl-tRNA(Gln) amidotransferase subunit C